MALHTHINPNDLLSILGYAFLTTVFAELTSWVLIYRKDEYKNLKKNIDNVTLKVSKQKDSYVTQSQMKSHEKKLNTIENQLKALNADMTAFRMKSTFLIGIFMIIIMSALGSEYQGVVVARLPFVPIFIVSGMSHRGLIGDDYTECSYLFIYIMASYIFRTNIQKICGFEPPKGSMNSMFNPPGLK